jgi:hypothetical protein
MYFTIWNVLNKIIMHIVSTAKNEMKSGTTPYPSALAPPDGGTGWAAPSKNKLMFVHVRSQEYSRWHHDVNRRAALKYQTYIVYQSPVLLHLAKSDFVLEL